jgi:rhamnogalacturonyl hydrolase YesR
MQNGENMKNVRQIGLKLLGVALCMVSLSACAEENPASAAELFAQRADNPFDAATIDAVGDKVADWQIARLDDLTYLRNYRNNIADRRGWVHGAMYVGMINWAALPGNDRFYDPLTKIAEEEEWKLGDRLFHGDDHIVGQMYLDLYNRETEKDQDKIDHTIRQLNTILAADPQNSLEFVGDSVRGVGNPCQIRWCWCDALFMSPQTWIMLTQATGEAQYLEFADKEFWATTEYLKDSEYNLYFRDSRYFNQQDEEGNKIFWARGNGWVFAGLVNILRLLPADHPSYSRYLQLYKDMSKTIAGLQHDNGFWRVSLLAKEKYESPETSGSGFMTYGLAWGVNNGHLDADEYGPVVKKGWKALLSAVGDDGMLGWVQPIGAAPDSVYETDSQLYGVGAFLLAASQMIQAN